MIAKTEGKKIGKPNNDANKRGKSTMKNDKSISIPQVVIRLKPIIEYCFRFLTQKKIPEVKPKGKEITPKIPTAKK